MIKKRAVYRVRCQQDKFWADKVLLDGIYNWILKKYDKETDVSLLKFNYIRIRFFEINREEHDEIIKDVCEEFDLLTRNVEIGCHFEQDKKPTRFHSYELERGVIDG